MRLKVDGNAPKSMTLRKRCDAVNAERRVYRVDAMRRGKGGGSAFLGVF